MKSALSSKTLWFNGIAVVLAVAIPILESQGYTGDLPTGAGIFVPAAIAAVNFVLRRFFTSTAIG